LPAFLPADPGAGEAVLIDPRGTAVPDLRALPVEHHLRLRWIPRTHDHDAMVARESSALVALCARVLERQVPRNGSGWISFDNGHVPWPPTPAPASPGPCNLKACGTACNATTMWPVVAPLHAAGFAVLPLDARCRGCSDDEAFTSVPRFAEDIAGRKASAVSHPLRCRE
jgi:hypothetical protein